MAGTSSRSGADRATRSRLSRAVHRLVDLLVGLLVLGVLALSTYVLFRLKGGH